MVAGAGLEPANPFGYWLLRPARLPIPPPSHISGIAGKLENCLCRFAIYIQTFQGFFLYYVNRLAIFCILFGFSLRTGLLLPEFCLELAILQAVSFPGEAPARVRRRRKCLGKQDGRATFSVRHFVVQSVRSLQMLCDGGIRAFALEMLCGNLLNPRRKIKADGF